MIRINLLGEERVKKGKPGTFTPQAVGAPKAAEGAPPYVLLGVILLLFVAVALLTMTYYYIRNTQMENTIAAQRVELKKYENARQKVDQLEKKKAEFTQKLDQIRQLKEQQSLPVRLMNRLVEVLPDGAWYTSVTQSGAGQIKVDGMARSIKTISTYYDNVVAIPDFVGPQMGNIRQASGPTEVYSFTMTFSYQVAGTHPGEVQKAAPAAPQPQPKPKAPASAGI
ncbi:MAG: PilN domain-containing protein [Acidobacteria bacterium]|jgi:type IV pilus assembly protein PilN|nr:PilN domain-containing protein [Acidobacteriota bacterium]